MIKILNKLPFVDGLKLFLTSIKRPEVVELPACEEYTLKILRNVKCPNKECNSKHPLVNISPGKITPIINGCKGEPKQEVATHGHMWICTNCFTETTTKDWVQQLQEKTV
jgi:hypothetical protein